MRIESVANWWPRSLLCAVVLSSLCAASPLRAADDDEDEPPLLPGIPARYEGAIGSEKITIERFDSLPTFLLAANEAPDSRLPAEGWSVTWRGLLMVRSPGEFRFTASASGPLRMMIGGKEILKIDRPADPATVSESPSIELAFGQHPVEIRFTQAGEGAVVRLFWESENFPREPIPPHVIGHTLKSHGLDPDRFPGGQLLVEEHSCVACHVPSEKVPLSKTLARRPGPHLTASGSRLNAAWIYHWLAEPRKFRPEAVMPALFANDRQGEIERYAVAKFLVSRGSPPREPRLDEGQRKTWPLQGQALFETLGCTVCHEKQGDIPARATLAGLGQKTTPAALAEFLRHPSDIDPAGRMPGFQFSHRDDPYRLALFLLGRDAAEFPPLALPEPPTDAELEQALRFSELPKSERARLAADTIEGRLTELARQTLRAKRCTACHDLQVPGEEAFWKPIPARHDFAHIARNPTGGCLDLEKSSAPSGVPFFGRALAAAPTLGRPADSLVAFLTQSAIAPGTPAPAAQARLTLQRLNCTGCHERNGTGGLPASLVAQMLTNQSEQNAEAVAPPRLTGIAEKLLASSFTQILEGNQRSRPWMGLQMPRFDKAHVASLPAGFSAEEGTPLQSEPYQPAAEPGLIEAGRALVGEKGFSCTKCHDMLGIATQGTRGPDLANVAQRVSFDWYERWMTDPQRMQPGTRMPTLFYGKRSPYPHVLDGIPDKQRLAIWQYLLVCRSLPWPDGLKAPGKLQFPPTEMVQVVRTFLPDLSARSMAIRSPQGIHLAFDAQACRLSYGWTGEFLDMRPVWDGRGGNKAILEGAVFWSAPPGFPWEVTPSASNTPDFSQRGTDTSLGAILPEDGRLYPTRLNFRKLTPLPDRTVLAYELEMEDQEPARFTESVAVFRNELATGLSREIVATAREGSFVWLHAALADEAPEWLNPARKSGRFDGSTHAAPGDACLKLIVAGKRYVLHQRNRATDCDWLAIRRVDKWSVILRAPVLGEPASTNLHLVVLKPLDDQPVTSERVTAQELEE